MQDDEKLPRTVVQRRIDARLAWLKAGLPDDGPMTANQKLAVVALISRGATLTEIAAMEGMPSESTIFRATRNDEQFAQDMSEARAMSATVNIDEAQHQLRESLETGDSDAVAMASQYHKATHEYAAKIAPREYGQLVKIAGADGGALTVQVVDYGTGNRAISTEASRATQTALPLQAQDTASSESS
jgi:hypothetical protein